MKAELLIDERHVIDDRAFVEIVVWQLPRPARGSVHRFKYRLALVVDGICVLRCDNEAGKGDHRHVLEAEQPYDFGDPDTLLADFWRDVESGDHEMKTVTLQVATRDEVKRRAQAAFAGKKQGARISFATPELLFRLMTAKRWELIRALAGAGAVTIREAARRVERDVKAVHGDVHALLKAGVLHKTEDGLIVFPFDAIHVDVVLRAA
jgi:predicted transcriptional regulator